VPNQITEADACEILLALMERSDKLSGRNQRINCPEVNRILEKSIARCDDMAHRLQLFEGTLVVPRGDCDG
jgi:hypothetical protein